MIKKIIQLILICFLTLMPVPLQAKTPGEAQQEIQDLQKQIDANKVLLDQKSKEVNSLKSQVVVLDAQIQNSELQISKTELQIDDLKNQIEQKEKELQIQKENLDETIVAMYESGVEQSTIEVIASSNNLTDMIDKSQYLESIREKINTTVDNITKLKADLSTKKNESEDLLAQLQEAKSSLSSQKTIKNSLLAETKGEESLYQKNLSELSQKQQAISRWLNWYVTYGNAPAYSGWDGKCQNGCGSSYDCDPQCVRYVSWRVGVGGWGDAHQWDDTARSKGYIVDSNPQKGDVMVWEIGSGMPYGHVAYVESVSDNSITVSQSNWGCACCYSTMSVPKSSWTEFIHF